MGNSYPLNPKNNLSFLVKWIVANLVGLPVLLLPCGIGYFLIASLMIAGDGMPIGRMGHAVILMILALSGAVIGAWLGLMQWLPLKERRIQSKQWIGASSFGVTIGAPLSWLAYIWFLESPIVHRPEGIYFSLVYPYLIFGILLGLTIGAAQWAVLRQQVPKAGWWILGLPVCFSLGVWFTNFYLSNTEVISLFALLSPIIALAGIGCMTGMLLSWLFRFPKTEREGA